MHNSSMMKMEYFKNTYLNPSDELKILDIGSFDKTGDFNYGIILNEEKWTYSGLDLQEGNNVDIVIKDPYNWEEIKNETFDVVISGQTFEHVEFFWITMEEIKRIMKPGGLCCIIVPSTGPVHKNPYDCYRFNENGVRSLAKCVKFDILESGTTEDSSSHPWYDSFVIARKPGTYNVTELEDKIDNIENKLDLILNELKG